jgi:DDE family transposase
MKAAIRGNPHLASAVFGTHDGCPPLPGLNIDEPGYHCPQFSFEEQHELCGGLDPMGEKQNQPFQLSFNPSLRVDFQGSRLTSDNGLLLVRELDERLGLSSLMAEHISDDRRGKNTQLPMPDLLRQSIYSRLAGYEDVTMLSGCHRIRRSG